MFIGNTLPQCRNNETMKRCNLKTCSYPFDWCFSDTGVVIDCIKDDFKVYLDASYYIHISENKCGHSKYGHNMWWHHNLITNENHYAYFARCVDRFKKLLKLKHRKMFVITFVNGEYGSYEDNFNEKVIEFNNELQKFTENYILLAITNKITQNKQSHAFKYEDNIHFLTLNTLSKSNGGQFLNDGDNTYLDNLLRKTYTFNLKDLE